MRLFDMDSKEDYLLDGKYKVATPYAPLVNVVEVVRCRDYRWWHDNGTLPFKSSVTGFCERLGTLEWFSTDYNDYCSFAERENDESINR